MGNEVAELARTLDALAMESLNLKSAAEGIFNTKMRLKGAEAFMDTLNDVEEMAEYQERHDKAYARILQLAAIIEEVKYG